MKLQFDFMKGSKTVLILLFGSCFWWPIRPLLSANGYKLLIQIELPEDSTFIYKKVNESEKGDEYADGSINLYDIKKHKSYQISKNEMIGKTEAWTTTDGRIVIFSLADIEVFDKHRRKIKTIDFKSDKLTGFGANYNKEKEIIFFLLGNIAPEKIDLCMLDLKTLEMTTIKRNLYLKVEDIEAPFKKLFFAKNNTVIIENDPNSFLSVDLHMPYNTHVIKYETESRFSYAGDFNKEGFVYLKYKNQNKNDYVINQYWLTNNRTTTLFDGKNAGYDPAPEIYSTAKTSSFVLQIDNKFYVYDSRSLKLLSIDKDSDIVFVTNQKIYYLNKSGNIAWISF